MTILMTILVVAIIAGAALGSLVGVMAWPLIRWSDRRWLRRYEAMLRGSKGAAKV